VPGKSVI